ncbi:MAG: alpha/beta hydrolase [Hyphomicrobiaceae bacterium]|nr:MAG: alpha/beta hydrolase [Hyphomicrobiaceae bacterium]
MSKSIGKGAPDRIVTPPPRIVRTARGPIECSLSGEGATLLALHGGIGGHDQSRLLARSLLDAHNDHRIVAVSRPGYLRTPLDAGRTPEEQADAYAALLDALGISTATVAAVSAGGPSAIQFAHRHPAKCRALVLVSACSAKLDASAKIMSRLRAMQALALVPGMGAFLRWRANARPNEAAARAISGPAVRARTLSHASAGVLFRALQLSVFCRMRERLPGTINDMAVFANLDPCLINPIVQPTLIVHGTADTVVSFSHAKADRRSAFDPN